MKRLALLLTAACASCASSSPAPIQYGAQGPAQDHAAPDRAPGPAPDWAEGEGTALSAWALRAEDVQADDPAQTPRSYRVGQGESLYDIASRFQIPLRALIDQNHLEAPYALAPGSTIELPPPRMHRVARGERFEDIAQRYNIDTRSLALLNRMSPPYEVREGQEIVLPAIARASIAPPAVVAATPAPPASAAAVLQWPVRGEVLTRFGRMQGGGQLDGIEIAVREGAEIDAAAAGEVVYAGSDLPAYGVLVLVRHADDYVTAYGHARRALVREGQSVRAGQAVAEAGGEGKILFQVRQGTRAVDPLPLLGN